MSHKEHHLMSYVTAVVCLTSIFGVTLAQNETDVKSCPDGYFGFECEKECSKYCLTATCHDMTGECIDGCQDGWFGNYCEYACKKGYYGPNCSTECSQNCLGFVCEPTTGDCIKGCDDGFIGKQCERVCPQGYWGGGCSSACPPNCVTPHCHFQTGYCLKGCKKDFWGVECRIFGQLKDVPDEMRGSFYNDLSAESRTVLLYILMGKYRHTLSEAARVLDEGQQQREELKQLLQGRGMRADFKKSRYG